MEPKSSLTVLITFALAFLIIVGASSTNNDQIQTTLDDGCQSYCGDVQIQYPFGVGNSSKTRNNCFMDNSFELFCNNIDHSLLWGNLQVTDMNITRGKFDIKLFVSELCYDRRYGSGSTKGNDPWLRIDAPGFTISSDDNMFISVGCDTYGYLTSTYGESIYSTGCLTRCYNNSTRIVDGECSGTGCCQVEIPKGMRNITLQTFSFENFNRTLRFNNCSYSFVAKNGEYNFSKNHLRYLPFETIPMVFDWSVGNETCKDSRNRGTNACKGNSTCVNSEAGYGYRCNCNYGFEGNPYHPNGCKDINECQIGNHTCISEDNCHNILGSYECFCPKGQSGNGTMQDPCHTENALPKYVIGGSAGFITLFVAIALLFLMYHKRKLIKLKEKFFKQNGGFMLLQQLAAREESSQTSAQIFTADELKKATKNYDENLIVGKGGYGTVFKGILSDNRVVAIKKSRIVDDESQIEQFINEVIVLSQINHRNVVKLLGCCLETQVPLLVYEFVNNGTLFEFLHNGKTANNSTWKIRLRIAAEAAGALSYLHSAASIPIIHRDVKSANILLDEALTAKVSDFGASRLVPLDQTALATMVQGTFGYLDPEYMQTSQLTDKSDVYSFGVVLVELLTGEKSISFDRPEDERSLAIFFLSCLKEHRLFDILQVGLLNDENKKEIEDVAILAAKCLRLKGEERPSMKEVAMELEGIRLMQKQSWMNNTDKNNLEEIQTLLPKSTFKVYEYGDSSSHQNTGYDSIKDQVLIAFDDGR